MAESVLVSARVPQAKKDASKGVLASLGVNTSDLINSAFDYLLERRSCRRLLLLLGRAGRS